MCALCIDVFMCPPEVSLFSLIRSHLLKNKIELIGKASSLISWGCVCGTGGVFDPLNLASSDDPERAFKLKTAEIKHGRLAMVAFLGFGIQALTTGEGALGSLAKFAGTFGEEIRELEAAL
jgi:Chlorophyll A-B binding protein